MTADTARTHGLLDLLGTAVVRLDGEGRILLLNSAAENCLLVSRDRARGRHLGDVAVMPENLRSAMLQVPADSQGVRLHDIQMGNSAYDCTIQRTDDGGTLLEFHDLEWERLRLRLQQHELQTGMLQYLSRNLGHEVRNPLGGIRGAAQMLADELESGDLATLARLIMRESDRIDELIQRFGRPELERCEIRLYPLLDEALDLLNAEFGRSVEIQRDFDPSIPSLLADASAIRIVILNLLRNACQAGATELVIRTRVEYGNALLQTGPRSVIRMDVIDDGPGVPDALRSLLFLPMVTGRRNGTGLGLALSQQIASAHGGLLTYEPLERGSCFSLYLPFGNGETEEGAA